jgi:hypothetical protein
MGLGNGSATADRFAAHEKSAPPSGYRPRGASDPATDTPFLGAFLDHLEKERDNSARKPQRASRRPPLVLSLCRLHASEYNALAQRVLAVQSKGYVRTPICFLTPVEIETCSLRRTSAPGAEDVIEPCCCWPCRPACARQNSPACAVRTSRSG